MKKMMIRLAVLMNLFLSASLPGSASTPAFTADGGVIPGLPPVLKTAPSEQSLADGGVLPGLPPVLKVSEPVPSLRPLEG